jgi:hypothetical protein
MRERAFLVEGILQIVGIFRTASNENYFYEPVLIENDVDNSILADAQSPQCGGSTQFPGVARSRVESEIVDRLLNMRIDIRRKCL